MAPPSGLRRCSSAPISASQATGTDANASFTSNTPMSPTASPERFSTRAVAGIGPVSIISGSAPLTAPQW